MVERIEGYKVSIEDIVTGGEVKFIASIHDMDKLIREYLVYRREQEPQRANVPDNISVVVTDHFSKFYNEFSAKELEKAEPAETGKYEKYTTNDFNFDPSCPSEFWNFTVDEGNGILTASFHLPIESEYKAKGVIEPCVFYDVFLYNSRRYLIEHKETLAPVFDVNHNKYRHDIKYKIIGSNPTNSRQFKFGKIEVDQRDIPYTPIDLEKFGMQPRDSTGVQYFMSRMQITDTGTTTIFVGKNNEIKRINLRGIEVQMRNGVPNTMELRYDRGIDATDVEVIVLTRKHGGRVHRLTFQVKGSSENYDLFNTIKVFNVKNSIQE